MATSRLQPLLEGAGLDALLSHVLPLLSLHDLGRLCAVSQRLHTIVSTAPAVWQASARSSLPHPQHPIHRAVSCQAYLRQQHAVHAAADSGGSSHDVHSLGKPGAPAPDLCKYAVLVDDDEGNCSLDVHDLSSEQKLASWGLPGLPYVAWVYSRHGLHWTQDSRLCALPWGAPWHDEWEGTDEAGLCIVDVQTGTITHVNLGEHTASLWWPGFTASGMLLVRHQAASQPVWTWTSYTAAGDAQHRTPSCCDELGYSEEVAMSPAGSQVVLYQGGVGPGSFDLKLWCPSSKAARLISLPADSGDLKHVVFSPSSGQLLCLTRSHALVLDLQGALLSVYNDLPSCPSFGCWRGDLVAITCRPDDTWASEGIHSTQLCLFTVQHLCLQLTRSLGFDSPTGAMGEWHFIRQPVISPDWQHVAVLAAKWKVKPGIAFLEGAKEKVLLLKADGTLCMRRSGLGKHHDKLIWAESGLALSSWRSSKDELSVSVVRFERAVDAVASLDCLTQAHILRLRADWMGGHLTPTS